MLRGAEKVVKPTEFINQGGDSVEMIVRNVCIVNISCNLNNASVPLHEVVLGPVRSRGVKPYGETAEPIDRSGQAGEIAQTERDLDRASPPHPARRGGRTLPLR